MTGLRAQWWPDRSAPVRLDLTLTGGERHNAQTPSLWAALRQARRELPGTVRLVVLRGEGPSFSSGIDTALLAGLVRDGLDEATLAEAQAAFDWSSDNAYVSVAVVHGHALGAGLQLALGADLRVVAEDAVLGLPEASYGLVPDLGGTWPLVRAVGYPTALELVATGRLLTGREAHAMGLAQRVVPADRLDEAVEELAGQLLAPDRDVVREVKALLRGAEGRTRPEQAAAERAAQLRRLADLADPPGSADTA